MLHHASTRKRQMQPWRSFLTEVGRMKRLLSRKQIKNPVTQTHQMRILALRSRTRLQLFAKQRPRLRSDNQHQRIPAAGRWRAEPKLRAKKMKKKARDILLEAMDFFNLEDLLSRNFLIEGHLLKWPCFTDHRREKLYRREKCFVKIYLHTPCTVGRTYWPWKFYIWPWKGHLAVKRAFGREKASIHGNDHVFTWSFPCIYIYICIYCKYYMQIFSDYLNYHVNEWRNVFFSSWVKWQQLINDFLVVTLKLWNVFSPMKKTSCEKKTWYRRPYSGNLVFRIFSSMHLWHFGVLDCQLAQCYRIGRRHFAVTWTDENNSMTESQKTLSWF